MKIPALRPTLSWRRSQYRNINGNFSFPHALTFAASPSTSIPLTARAAFAGYP